MRAAQRPASGVRVCGRGLGSAARVRRRAAAWVPRSLLPAPPRRRPDPHPLPLRRPGSPTLPATRFPSQPGPRASSAGSARPPSSPRRRSQARSLPSSHTTLSRSLPARRSGEESSAARIDSSALCGRPAPNSSVCSELDFPRRRPRRRRHSGGGGGGGGGGGCPASTPGPRHFGLGASAAQALKAAAGARGSAAPRCGREVRSGPPLLGPCPGPDPPRRRRAGPAATE